jgi:hypothetical protein
VHRTPRGESVEQHRGSIVLERLIAATNVALADPSATPLLPGDIVAA